jgi:hypothetical protein
MGPRSSVVKEGASHQQTRNCLTVIKIWFWEPDGCFTPRETDRLTVGHEDAPCCGEQATGLSARGSVEPYLHNVVVGELCQQDNLSQYFGSGSPVAERKWRGWAHGFVLFLTLEDVMTVEVHRLHCNVSTLVPETHVAWMILVLSNSDRLLFLQKLLSAQLLMIFSVRVHKSDHLKQFSILSIFLISWGGVRLSPLSTSVTNWPIVPVPDDRWVWNIWWNENWQGKPKYSEKTCPSATLSTTDPTCLSLARTRAAAAGSRRLTACAMARSFILCNSNSNSAVD